MAVRWAASPLPQTFDEIAYDETENKLIWIDREAIAIATES